MADDATHRERGGIGLIVGGIVAVLAFIYIVVATSGGPVDRTAGDAPAAETTAPTAGGSGPAGGTLAPIAE